MAETNGRTWGVLGQFETPAAIYSACEKIRDAGFTRWDTCTPFPVHGLDKAMGLKSSILPWIVLVCGMSGSAFMLAFMIWAMKYDFPIVVSGKPLLSIPAFVPIWYEFTVLSSCLTIFFGNWFLNRLPMLYYPAFKSKAFERATDDKFFVVIEAADPKFSLDKTRSMLSELGASHVEELED